MPESLLFISLKALAPKLLPFLFKQLPQNTPTAKAKGIAVAKYTTRVPDLERALDIWTSHDQFRSVLEKLQNGGTASNFEIEHVDLFISTTGLSLGIVSLDLAREVLLFFYSELNLALFDGPHPGRMVGATLAAIRDGATVKPADSPSLHTVSYSPHIELDTNNRAQTAEDTKAEAELNLIKALVDKRQSKTALVLLSTIQAAVDNGTLSAPVRFRFYVNKGVCYLLTQDLESAQLEFERARALEPSNPKALINLAQMAILRGSHTVASEFLQKVLEKEPLEPNANALWIACLHGLGRHDEVRELVEQNSELLKVPYVLYTLAFIAFEKGQFAEAEHYLLRHNELDAVRGDAWELLGRAILAPSQARLRQTIVSPNWIPKGLRDRIEEAERCFSQAEALVASTENRRELIAPLVNRGVTRSLLQRYDDARRDFERAHDLDPTQDEILRNLAHVHLTSGRPQDAVSFFAQIKSTEAIKEAAPFLAASYLQLGNLQRVLETLEPHIDSPAEGRQFFVLDLYLEAAYRLKDRGAESRAVGILSQHLDEPEANRILAEQATREGNSERENQLLKTAIEVAPPDGKARYQLLLADHYYRLKKFVDAAVEYERIPVPLEQTPECRRYLGALYVTGRFSKALIVAETVRGERNAVADFSEIEARIYESSGSLDAAQRLRESLLANGCTVSLQRIKLALLAFRRGSNEEAEQLVLKVQLDDIGDDDVETMHDAAFLRTVLKLPGPLAFAHRMLDIDGNSAEMHRFYVSTFFNRTDNSGLDPEEVGEDTVVTIERGSEVQVLKIVAVGADHSKGHLGISHPLAQALIGKKVGDRIRFPLGELSESEYKIAAIRSKFVATFQDCIGHYNERFPADRSMSRVDFKEGDISDFVLMADRRRRFTEGVLDVYNKGKVPACAVAKMFGLSDLQAFRALVGEPKTKLFSFEGSRGALDKERNSLDEAECIILEASALISLHSLGLLPTVRSAFDAVHVTQLLVDTLAEILANIRDGQKATMYSESPGTIRMVEITPEDIAAERDFYGSLRTFILENCSVSSPVTTLALEQSHDPTTRDALGSLAVNTLLTAKELGLLMVSDDLPLRGIGLASFSVAGVGSLSLLRSLCAKQKLASEECHRSVHWYNRHGYSFVSTTKEDILWVLRRDGWSPTQEVATSLQSLAGPESNPQEALVIGSAILHALWHEPLMHSTQVMTTDLLLNVLATGRVRIEVGKALLALHRQRSLLWTPAASGIEQAINIWLSKQ